jgi:hypothetical protein
MGRFVSRKRTPHTPTLPNDVLHIIFSSLEFIDKINSGLVCKQWEQVLREDTLWVVEYNVDTLVSAPTMKAKHKRPETKQLDSAFQRYVRVL